MKKRIFLLAISSLFIIIASAWAVVPLTGLVRTGMGAPIPGATITITSTSSGVAVTAVSDNDGLFVAGVPEGACTITVTSSGFQSVTTSLQLTGETGVEVILLEDGCSGTSTIGPENVFAGVPDFPGSGAGAYGGYDAGDVW